MENTKGTAVVTGASGGIGEVYAHRLAEQGYDLVLIARSTEKLARVAVEIWSKTRRRVNVFPADLTEPSDLARVEKLLRTNSDIRLLVNNAGFGGAGTLLETDVDQMSKMITLNVTALTRLTYAIVPQFVFRGAGTIINIASIVAINPEVLNGVYGGTKAFVHAFSQSLRQELEGTGVRVQVVLPGATATDLWSVMGGSVDNLPPEIVMSPEDLVDAALAGLDRGEFVTIPSLQDGGLWDAYEEARRAMFGKLSTHAPAPRYRLAPDDPHSRKKEFNQ
jgi:short-subunit dehydrogenase